MLYKWPTLDTCTNNGLGVPRCSNFIGHKLLIIKDVDRHNTAIFARHRISNDSSRRTPTMAGLTAPWTATSMQFISNFHFPQADVAGWRHSLWLVAQWQGTCHVVLSCIVSRVFGFSGCYQYSIFRPKHVYHPSRTAQCTVLVLCGRNSFHTTSPT